MDKNAGNEVPLLPGRWTQKQSPNPLLNIVMENDVVAVKSTNLDRERIDDNIKFFDFG